MSWSRVVYLSMLVFELYYTLRPSTLKRANCVKADVIFVILSNYIIIYAFYSPVFPRFLYCPHLSSPRTATRT